MARAGRNDFIHPTPIGIAINANGGEIADPLYRRRCFDLASKSPQHWIACLIGSGGNQHRISLVERRGNFRISMVAIEDHDLAAGLCVTGRFVGRSNGCQNG